MFVMVMVMILRCVVTSQVRELRVALGPLSGRDLLYCTDACLRRYLVARNWNLEKAKTMLEETLKWRADYKPEDIRWVRQQNRWNVHVRTTGSVV